MTNKKQFRIKKMIKRKGDKLYSNRKVMIIHLIVELIEKILYRMSQYFLKPYITFGGNINIKVDLSNDATETDLRKQQKLIHLV